ncbi:MAG: fumarylacetoacetate hydrolase family protein [Nakamurella sp.]
MTGDGLTADTISPAQIAEILIAGERERKEVPQISETYGDVDIDKAYQAQQVFVQSKLDAGERLVGYKLGLTSRNKQRAMGVDSPLYGRVTSSMLSTYGDPIPFDRFIHPRVESEIAFLIGKDLAAPATVTSVLAATDLIYGAVDVLDSRYAGFKFTLSDVVADNASAGAFYLGPIARPPAELDLHTLGCVVRVDGEVVMTAAGAAVMGHPAASVAWLVNQLAEQGETVKAGSLIFSGGVTAPVPVVAGGSVTFEFDGLGVIECYGA